MSTVLWANVLVDGQVRSDETDHPALYKFADKLDALTKELGTHSFLGICDTTDQRFNLDDAELPPGMTSTNEVMAVQGLWMPITPAVEMLAALRGHIVEKKVRFGFLSNHHDAVVAELDEVLAFARSEAGRASMFNFCVVM